MRILLYGVGALGSLMAHFLCKAVTGGLPVTDTVFGGLHAPANPEDINKIKKALKVNGYRVTEVEDMYAYYMYHVAEIVPYCLMCYKVNYNLKSLRNEAH